MLELTAQGMGSWDLGPSPHPGPLSSSWGGAPTFPSLLLPVLPHCWEKESTPGQHSKSQLAGAGPGAGQPVLPGLPPRRAWWPLGPHTDVGTGVQGAGGWAGLARTEAQAPSPPASGSSSLGTPSSAHTAASRLTPLGNKSCRCCAWGAEKPRRLPPGVSVEGGHSPNPPHPLSSSSAPCVTSSQVSSSSKRGRSHCAGYRKLQVSRSNGADEGPGLAGLWRHTSGLQRLPRLLSPASRLLCLAPSRSMFVPTAPPWHSLWCGLGVTCPPPASPDCKHLGVVGSRCPLCPAALQSLPCGEGTQSSSWQGFREVTRVGITFQLFNP